MLDLHCLSCKSLADLETGNSTIIEAYMNNDSELIWDITWAKIFIKQCRKKPIIVDFAKVARIEYPDTKPHIEHVDFNIPGILDYSKTLLIDGNHRAAKAIKYGAPFTAFVLSKKQNERCLYWGRRLMDDYKLEFSK